MAWHGMIIGNPIKSSLTIIEIPSKAPSPYAAGVHTIKRYSPEPHKPVEVETLLSFSGNIQLILLVISIGND